MEITIKPEDVDKLVRDAILTAGIGKVITEQVAAALKVNSYSRDGFIENAIKTYIQSVCAEVIRDGYGEQIKAAVTALVQEKVTPVVIEKIATEAVEKLIAAAELRRTW